VQADLAEAVSTAICRRILVALSLYAVGALLSLFSTYASIGFIGLVQLNYAVAPRLSARVEA